MLAFHALLRFAEERQVALPVAAVVGPNRSAFGLEGGGPVLAETFKEFVLEGDIELTGTDVTLPAGAAGELAVDPQRLVPLSAQHVQPADLEDARFRLD